MCEALKYAVFLLNVKNDNKQFAKLDKGKHRKHGNISLFIGIP